MSEGGVREGGKHRELRLRSSNYTSGVDSNDTGGVTTRRSERVTPMMLEGVTTTTPEGGRNGARSQTPQRRAARARSG